MAVETKEPQPQSTVERFNALAAAAPPEPEVPEAASPAAPEAPQFDPATYKIPGSAVPNVPKSFEKFKDKTLTDVFTSYENAERWGHEKAGEAAQAKRENDELRSRLAAAEQVARMTPQPQAPQADHWQRAGVNPDEQTFTAPRQVFDTTLSIADQRARAVADEAAKRESAAIRAELQAERQANALFDTFETAREKLKPLGHDITKEQWRESLKYIAPVVAQEGKLFEPDRYVEHYVGMKGPGVKATIPAEGSPPVATRPAAISHDKEVPTLTREEKQLNKRIREAMGLKD